MNKPLLNRREHNKLVVRETILTESKILINRFGIDGTTIDAICDCANIAKKTFYNYYSSKHDLLSDICKSTLLTDSEHHLQQMVIHHRDLKTVLHLVLAQTQHRLQNASRLEREVLDYMVSNLGENREQGVSLLIRMNTMFNYLYQHYSHQLKPQFSAEFCAEMTVGIINNSVINWLNSADYNLSERFSEITHLLVLPISCQLSTNIKEANAR